MRLLELSLLKTGWIQPILIDAGGVIIDGFHRATLARTSKALRERDNGLAPCCVLDLSEPERMLLTVRINRAKGSHAALKMHDLVSALVHNHCLDVAYIAESIGATKQEIELLLQEGVFKALGTEHHRYSKAWVPAAKSKP